jgi:hypothetical protein
VPEPNLKQMYRMPTVFGPAPGPRNVPEEKAHLRFTKETTVLTVTAHTDPVMLAALLPPRCTLDGEARLEVSVCYFSRIGWLAGRGYNIVMVRIPATFACEQERLRGYFIHVLWESLCDPILTGREELGWPKLYAEIPDPIVLEEGWRGSASWEGFRFFDIEAGRFAPSVGLRISGTFDPSDPDSLVAYLGAEEAVQVSAPADGNVHLSRGHQ